MDEYSEKELKHVIKTTFEDIKNILIPNTRQTLKIAIMYYVIDTMLSELETKDPTQANNIYGYYKILEENSILILELKNLNGETISGNFS